MSPRYLRYAPLTKLSERLWLGGLADVETSEAREHLRSLGITHIVNLAAGTDDELEPLDHGFTVLRVEQEDGEPIPRETIDHFLAWMKEHQDAKMLIHCAAGISRTPSFVIAWEMEQLDARGARNLASLWEGLERDIAAARPVIWPSGVLRQSVLDYFGRAA